MTKVKTVITLEQLQATIGQPCDNTGNVREWPSEEVLAYYLQQRGDQVQQVRRVIELGAGKSGLVGLVVASMLQDKAVDFEVVITDGNEKCCESLQRNIELNGRFQDKVKQSLLLWNRNEDPEPRLGKFDQILISDCLFFEKFHIDLVYTLK